MLSRDRALLRAEQNKREREGRKARAQMEKNGTFPKPAAGHTYHLFVACTTHCNGTGTGTTASLSLLKPLRVPILLGDIHAVAQVSKCTCLLSETGQIWPAAYFDTTKGWDRGTLVDMLEWALPMPCDESIQSIHSCGNKLLGVGVTDTLYLWEYEGYGSFTKSRRFPRDIFDGGALAIGPNSIFGFCGSEIKDRDMEAALHTMALDSGGAATKQLNWKLHKGRVGAKLAQGHAPSLVLAFDLKGKSKVYAVKKEDGKLGQVGNLKEGLVVDIAANPTLGFVLTNQGHVAYSRNFKEWINHPFEKTGTKLAAGESFALCATTNNWVVVMMHSKDNPSSLQDTEWDLNSILNKEEDDGRLVVDTIVGMDGSNAFACVLAKVKTHNTVASGSGSG